MSPMINSVNVTEACARALVVLGSSPAKIDDFDSRVPRTLASNGLAIIEIVSARTRQELESTLTAVVAGDITVHSVAYAIGPKGEREALILYSDGASLELWAAVRAWLKEQVA